MGFLARAFIRLHEATGQKAWADKAEFALQWLIDHQSPNYSGACWGNHFDYQSRSFYLPKGVPTIVWTSLIGHAFLDGFDHFKNDTYLNVAVSACDHILRDLATHADGDSVCISYIPGQNKQVHNSNTLGASLLARTYSHTGNEAYRALAEKAIKYTAKYQRADSSWYYGEACQSALGRQFPHRLCAGLLQILHDGYRRPSLRKEPAGRLRLLEEYFLSC